MSLSPISGSSAPITNLVAAFSPSPTGGNPTPDLPVARTVSDPVPPVPQQPAPAPAAEQIQIDTEPIRSDLSMEFKWNDTANRLVVVVMDTSSGTVIQQLPPQQVLDLVRDAVKATQQELHR